jgi:hypothetical protein
MAYLVLQRVCLQHKTKLLDLSVFIFKILQEVRKAMYSMERRCPPSSEQGHPPARGPLSREEGHSVKSGDKGRLAPAIC